MEAEALEEEAARFAEEQAAKLLEEEEEARNKAKVLTHSLTHLLTHSPNHLLTHSSRVRKVRRTMQSLTTQQRKLQLLQKRKNFLKRCKGSWSKRRKR